MKEPGTLKDFILRRVVYRANLTFGGVDWVAINAMQNSHLPDLDHIKLADRLELVTPQIPGIAPKPRATCSQQDHSEATVPLDEIKTTVLLDEIKTTVPLDEIKATNQDVASPSADPSSSTKEADQQVAIRAYMMRQDREKIKSRAIRMDEPAVASHAGIRLGFPIMLDSILLPKMRLINMFVQIKDGPLAGFTLFSDFVAKVTDTFEQNQFAIQWQRLGVGWAFGTDFSGIMRRIEIVPRLGHWTLNAALPRAFPGDGGLGVWSLKTSKPSLGLEGSLALKLLKAASVRLWHGRDVVHNLTKNSTSGAVSAQRTGIDVFLPGFDFRLFYHDFKFVSVIYGMHEAMYLSSNDVASTKLWQVADSQTDGESYYGIIYCGIGFTITF